MQTNLYKYANISPVDFWKYTPGETVMMISASIENLEFEHEITNKLEARLCAIVLSANGVLKPGKKPYGIEDFMPQKKDIPRTVEDLEQMAIAATKKMGGVVLEG